MSSHYSSVTVWGWFIHWFSSLIGMCICVCVCVCVPVCLVHMYVSAYVYGDCTFLWDQSSTSGIFLWSLREDLFLNPEFTISARLVATESPGFVCLHRCIALRLQACTTTSFLMDTRGFECRFSHLYSKQFKHWTIFPACMSFFFNQQG